jgi:hypothetical protein
VLKCLTISGGWNAEFTLQTAMTTLDGGAIGASCRTGGMTTIERFVVANGSGIYNDGYLTLNTSVVRDNQAAGVLNDGYMTINNSTISGNTNAFAEGGGIRNGRLSSAPVLVVNNTTISGNSAYWMGGGIYNNFHGSVYVNNSTVVGNSASFAGGGIVGGAPGITTLRNTIVALNTAGSGGGDDCIWGPVSAGYNIIRIKNECDFVSGVGDLVGLRFAPFEPYVGPLQNNGGPTFTHALLSISPAINSGNPAGCADNNGGNLPFDQRGAARVGRCDRGAYEFGGAVPLPIHIFVPFLVR